MVIKDLVSYDGLKLELEQTIELLNLERQKSQVNDSIISSLEEKIKNLNEIIGKKDEQFSLEREKSESLLKELKGQRRKTFLYKLGSTVGLIATSILILGK